MSRSDGRTVPCDAPTRTARLAKAEQFLTAAEALDPELREAYVSLCVLAGFAAADVICCSRLGKRARGDDHGQAVELLASADRTLGRHLDTLLSLKSKAAYSAQLVSSTSGTKAGRAASALLEAARLLAAST